jgi:quercetin dioxygenase-like cupin family protein
MAIVDHAALPEFPMRPGATGKWIAGREHGGSSLSMLSSTVEPNVAIPKHYHEYEELILVEEGRIWVNLDGVELSASSGQAVTIPPNQVHAWGNAGPGIVRALFIWPVLEPFAPGKSTYVEGAPPTVS